MKFGCEALALVEYPKHVLAGVPKGFRVKSFLKWGKKDSLAAITQLAASGKFPELPIHLAAFDYSHQYPISKLIKGVLADAKRCEQVAKKYPVKIDLSAFCEHKHNAREMEPVFEDIQKVAPSCGLFNSIYGRNQEVSGIITELHLQHGKDLWKPKGPYGVGTDGFGSKGEGNLSDANVDKLLQFYFDSEYFDVWGFFCNGKYGWKDTRDIAHRDDYAYKEVLAGYCALVSPREGELTFSDKMLLKPFADDHDEADSIPNNKDNRFMAILPWAGTAQVLDSKDKVIDTLRRAVGDYNSGGLKGPRYYSKYYAFQLGDIAFKNTGSRQIRIKVGNNKTPLTDARKRSGRF